MNETHIFCVSLTQSSRTVTWFHFIMSCLKLLSDIDYLKLSWDWFYTEIANSIPRSTTWPLLSLWVALSQSLKISVIIAHDISILTLKISVAKYWRFVVWIVTDLSFSNSWKKRFYHCIQYVALSCNILFFFLIKSPQK